MELKPLPRGFASGTQGTCITLLVPIRNVISEQKRLQNKNGEKSGENRENGKNGEKSGENGENYNYDTGFFYATGRRQEQKIKDWFLVKVRTQRGMSNKVQSMVS